MVLPFLALAGRTALALTPVLGKITPAIGRGLATAGKFVGKEFLKHPFKTTALATSAIFSVGLLKESPTARDIVLKTPSETFKAGQATGQFIEGLAPSFTPVSQMDIAGAIAKAGLGAALVAGGIALGKTIITKQKEKKEKEKDSLLPPSPLFPPVSSPSPLSGSPAPPSGLPSSPLGGQIPTTPSKEPEGLKPFKVTVAPKITTIIQNAISR